MRVPFALETLTVCTIGGVDIVIIEEVVMLVCIELDDIGMVIIMDVLVLVCIELVDIVDMVIIVEELVCMELDDIKGAVTVVVVVVVSSLVEVNATHMGDEVGMVIIEDDAMLDDIIIMGADELILGAFGAALVGIIAGAAEEDHPLQAP